MELKRVLGPVVVLTVAIAMMGAIAETNGIERTKSSSRDRMFRRPDRAGIESRVRALEEKKLDERTLNWTDASSEIILQTYADFLGKTCLIDSSVPKCKISLKSLPGQTLTREEYCETIEAALELNGIHVELFGDRFLRVMPRKDARRAGIPLIMEESEELPDSHRVVSMMIRFKYISVAEAYLGLEGFKSDYGVMTAYERINAILVTDSVMNINRMLKIAKGIDLSTPVLEQVFLRQLKYAKASDVKNCLDEIVKDSQKNMDNSEIHPVACQQKLLSPNRPFGRRQQPQASAANISNVICVSDADRGFIRGSVFIFADDRTNKLIIRALKSNMDFFDKVIMELDIEDGEKNK